MRLIRLIVRACGVIYRVYLFDDEIATFIVESQYNGRCVNSKLIKLLSTPNLISVTRETQPNPNKTPNWHRLCESRYGISANTCTKTGKIITRNWNKLCDAQKQQRKTDSEKSSAQRAKKHTNLKINPLKFMYLRHVHGICVLV